VSTPPKPGPPAEVPSIEAYADLVAALSSGADPDDVLAARGLDAEAWEAADAYWQGQMTAAMDGPEDGVPPLLVAYAEAFARKEHPRADDPPMPLEAFARAAHAVQTGDPSRALADLGVDFADFLRANEYWTPRLAQDRELAEAFVAALGQPSRR
jgi:hypothetical protein